MWTNLRKKIFSPLAVPVWGYLSVIFMGACFLYLDPYKSAEVSFINSLFTATSAACVTGLSVVNIGTEFSLFGQTIILLLIQIGGLGIMTYTTLIMVLFHRKVSFFDRVAIKQSLSQSSAFSFKKFLFGISLAVFCIELIGAVFLYLLDPIGFHPYSALFHSISAFCNAGFSLYAESLIPWQGNIGIIGVFSILIILGGVGFSVLYECGANIKDFFLRKRKKKAFFFSWQTQIVLETTFMLLFIGAALIFFAEQIAGTATGNIKDDILIAFFQSVTARTAGFQTVNLSNLSSVTLLLMLALMFIGGSPGSCSGGLKTITFRAWIGFIVSRLRGREQIRIGRFALEPQSFNMAVTMTVFVFLAIFLGVFSFSIFENNFIFAQAKNNFFAYIFETVSAFSTVGLSLGLTNGLDMAGKIISMLLMFIGRLGPVWLLMLLQSLQRPVHYKLAEEILPFS